MLLYPESRMAFSAVSWLFQALDRVPGSRCVHPEPLPNAAPRAQGGMAGGIWGSWGAVPAWRGAHDPTPRAQGKWQPRTRQMCQWHGSQKQKITLSVQSDLCLDGCKKLRY